MKVFVIIATFFTLTIQSNVEGQILPEKDSVLSQMVLANKYFMDKWPDPGEDIVTDRVRASNLWTRATYYEGLMALYYTYSDTAYYKYAVDWGESHQWKLSYDVDFNRNADYQCCAQTYIELYQLDNKFERIETIKNCIDIIKSGNDYNDWDWIDAIQMAMPVYAKLGVVLNDTSYFNAMHKFYMHSRDIEGDSGLYNDQEHLWWRDKDFDPPHTTPSGKNQYWSRGNGWVLAALTRVLDVLPDTSEYREGYIETFKEMCDTLIKIQRKDGFWNPSLVDSLDFGGKETSGTSFLTYGIAWGINHGILDESTFKPAIVKAWNGLVNDALHPNGFLGWVQGTGKQPSDGQPLSYDKAPNFEDYGLGAFLLAGSEVIKLAPGTQSQTKPTYEYYHLTTSVTGEGTISSSADSATKFTNVEITATPNEGWRFYNWTGSINTTENPVTINVLTDVSITANFIEIPPILTIQENEPGFCSVDGTIDNDRYGFTGDGLANTTNALGSGINYYVEFTQTGTFSFIFRYASINNRPAKVLLDNEVLFTSNFPATGNWTDWDSINVNASVEAGLYTLRLEATSNDGLGNIDYLTIEGDSAFAVTCPTGINDLHKENSFTLFPTIVNNEFFVTISAEMQQPVMLNISDITGKTYISSTLSGLMNTINVAGIKPGIYFITLSNQGFTDTKKIIIK